MKEGIWEVHIFPCVMKGFISALRAVLTGALPSNGHYFNPSLPFLCQKIFFQPKGILEASVFCLSCPLSRNRKQRLFRALFGVAISLLFKGFLQGLEKKWLKGITESHNDLGWKGP